jgi:hypothetical protein
MDAASQFLNKDFHPSGERLSQSYRAKMERPSAVCELVEGNPDLGEEL